MRKALAAAGSAAFFALAPGVTAGLVPWWLTGWDAQDTRAPLVVLGALLIAAGLVVLVQAFARFVVEGVGTPAPVAPTEHLVVGGMYRFVRNPMYVAVVSTIVGQALLFGSSLTLAYGLCAWLVMHLFVLTYEEPTLRKRYGNEYARFCANVPRWIPRVRPWSGSSRL